MAIIVKKSFIQLVQQKYQTEAKSCRKVNAFYKDENQKNNGKVGYLVDEKYFIDIGTQEIFEKSYFYLINDIEDFED